MLLAFVWIIVGLICLVIGGDRFVAGASAMARNFGVSPLLVGLTIVAFGTSAPEIFVGVVAAIRDNPGIAVGNAIGSNITNVGLVIGFTALLFPIKVESKTLKREYPILFFIMVFVFVLLLNGYLGRIEGLLLIFGLIALLAQMVRWGLKERNGDPLSQEFSAEIPEHMPNWRATLWLFVGLVLLPLGSEVFVNGAVTIARHWGVSDFVIGLTIVAVGTSLPELFAALMGMIKNEPDLAMGSILGSNMFNLLAVLGFPVLITPTELDSHILTRDYPIMAGMTVLLFILSYHKRHPEGKLGRLSGGFLLLCFIGYMALLGYQN